MSEFVINQLYIQSTIIFNILASILFFILLIYIFYLIFLSIKYKNSKNKNIEEVVENDILNAIYGTTCVDNIKIEQTLDRLYGEKQHYQKLYITFFNYSIIIVNVFLAISIDVYTKIPLLKEYFYSITLIASVILYFIYVYMDNLSVQINNQTMAIEYLEQKICMNIQKFSFNGYYKSSSNILKDRSILQYIVIIFAIFWVVAGAIISSNEDNMCENLILSIVALFIFPFLLLMEKHAKNKKKSMIEGIKNS